MTETAVLTLAEFLLARIAEDEAAGTAGDGWNMGGWADDAPVQFWDYGETHVGYRRFLAECEAKRQIVTNLSDPWTRETYWTDDVRRLADCVLRSLALPYANHPDYRQEWKP